MATRYRHTQGGWTLLVVLGTGLAVVLGLAIETERPIAFAAAGLIGLVLVLMSSLTAVVNDGTLTLYFGPGLIRRCIDLRRIRSVAVVRTPWYYGWGIRLTPYGWLWNVSGLGGVELRFEDGGRFRVGSDEPDRLAEAIRRGITAAHVPLA